MYILGISAFYHDSSAALLKDGEIVAAAQEERFTRIKNDASFPINAIRYCLSQAGIGASALEHVIFYEDPASKLYRLVRNHTINYFSAFHQFLEKTPSWLTTKFSYKGPIRKALGETFTGTISCCKHHQSHAASAFFPSPFAEANILTIDGVGELESASISKAEGNNITPLRHINFPNSVGLLYSAFTAYCGFKINSGEYKLMGLAPYGRPKYVDLIKNELVEIFDDGSIRLNLDYFPYCHEDRMYNERLVNLLGVTNRTDDGELNQAHADIAASIQRVTEEIVVKMASFSRTLNPSDNLCMAGGVALNCVANREILKKSGYRNIWIQPAAGDAGGALGAALHYFYQVNGSRRSVTSNQDKMKGSYLGPSFTNAEIQSALDDAGLKYERFEREALYRRCAEQISQGKVVGWFQGRMEFGPRALGNRSILGDARNPGTQREMNLKIKFRESFRPFAPSVLTEHADRYFDLRHCTPYMLMVSDVRQELRKSTPEGGDLTTVINQARSELPAITHVDYSARVQTVDKETNPEYHALISAFHELTGTPVVVNTSFNVRGEPIVCYPSNAIRCFINTGIDALAIGDFLVEKDRQTNLAAEENYAASFDKD